MTTISARTADLCARLGLRVPILLAPMGGVKAPQLSIAVANAGGMGACGALLMEPDEIHAWCAEVRAGTAGPFQLNLWIPDPAPVRNAAREGAVREFLARWSPRGAAIAGDATPPDFRAQFDAVIESKPFAISSIMGLYPPRFVERIHAAGIIWMATVTTVRDARAAQAAGADIIVAQGAEAGGHRGAFDAATAERGLVGLFSLLPAVVDAVTVPVIAAGGIADGRGIAAALTLGASGVELGTAFLRCPESAIHAAWAAALGETAPEDTVLSRVFSGRLGRSIETAYVRAATDPSAPPPAAYPVQRALTMAMRTASRDDATVDRVQAWAGQSASLSRAMPAEENVHALWQDATRLLGEWPHRGTIDTP